MFTRAEALKQFATWGGALLLGGGSRRKRGPAHLMDAFYVPEGVGLNPSFDFLTGTIGTTIAAPFYLVPQNGALSIGSPIPLLTVPQSDAPTVLQRWSILAIYLPLALYVEGDVGGTAPSVCDLTIYANVSGAAVWQANQQVSLVSNGVANVVVAATAVSDDLVNPFTIGAGQKLSFSYTAVFNQDVTGLAIYLCSELAATPGGNFAPAPQLPGTIRYQTIYDRRLPGRG